MGQGKLTASQSVDTRVPIPINSRDRAQARLGYYDVIAGSISDRDSRKVLPSTPTKSSQLKIAASVPRLMFSDTNRTFILAFDMGSAPLHQPEFIFSMSF